MKKKELEKIFLFKELSKFFDFDNWVAARGFNDLIVPKTRLLIDDNNLESSIILKDDESPVLELYINDEDFVVFTTKSLYIRRDGISYNKTFSEHRNVYRSNSVLEKLRLMYEDLIKERNKGVYMLDIPIVLDDESFLKLRVENSSPFSLVMLLVDTDHYLKKFDNS